jgi:hypothetical protein
MKNYLFLVVFVLFGFSVDAQKSFKPKPVNAKSIKSVQIESDSLVTSIYAYLIENYKPVSEKTDLSNHSEVTSEVCAFTLQFEHGISYTFKRCSEEGPLEEAIVFPKTDLSSLKKWIEDIHHIDSPTDSNVWLKERNIFQPADDGAGCYYRIISTEENHKVEVWCGC